MVGFVTLDELVDTFESNHNVAVSWNEKNTHKELSYDNLHELIVNVSKGLDLLGLKKGDTVSIISGNNYLWHPISLGCNYNGLIDVPRDTDISLNELSYILNHSESRAVFVETKSVLDLINSNLGHFDFLEKTIFIGDSDDYFNVSNLVELGKNNLDFKKNKILSDDSSSIIYTSGTTGQPKGVELSHGNFVSNIHACTNLLDVSSSDKWLSILPKWHVLERTGGYVGLASGSEIFHSSLKELKTDLKNESPTLMVSVPRIWKSVYDGMRKQASSSKIGGFLFDKAPKLLYPIISSKLKSALGGQLRYAISGGGSLPVQIERFFRNMGVNILNGYGMTETSPVITAQDDINNSYGSVGKVVGDYNIKILDVDGSEVRSGIEGIIHANGDNLMKGYFKNQDETDKIINYDSSGNRWINTGDIGYINKSGDLVISGRAKEIIVLLSGENIYPEKIENELIKSRYIDSVVITGKDNWKELGALIVPNKDCLIDYCNSHNISYVDYDYSLLNNSDIMRLYKNEIYSLINSNKEFRIFERVGKFEFIIDPFNIGDELTHTFKLRRKEIENKYREKIDSLYSKIHERK
jgi:long-chain acyl-CoA synthetase